MNLVNYIDAIQPKIVNKNIACLLSQAFLNQTQPAITCSKLTIETPEQGVKYFQS